MGFKHLQLKTNNLKITIIIQ